MLRRNLCFLAALLICSLPFVARGQEYDVFLSHSSLDVNELLQLKVLLNQQGKTVYIDWINDRVMLNRQNQNQDTWKALELRMDQSKMLLYVLTDNSIKSPCTEREVLYFKNAVATFSSFTAAPETVTF